MTEPTLNGDDWADHGIAALDALSLMMSKGHWKGAEREVADAAIREAFAALRVLIAGDKAEAAREARIQEPAAGPPWFPRGRVSDPAPDGEVITDANGDELEHGAGDKAEAAE